ncbi:MAG: hypothetical protein ACPGNT_07455 [Rhodospirillales bacterium]
MRWAEFHALCQRTFRRSSSVTAGPLSESGLAVFPTLDEATCTELRDLVDKADTRLTDRTFFLEIFARLLGPALEAAILGRLGCEFAPLWWQFLRDDPGAEANYSFFWHCDGGPTSHLKLLTYLTGSEETGASTLYLDRTESDGFRKLGYAFCPMRERLADLSALAKKHSLPFHPQAPDMKAGDTIVFEPMNLLHRGFPPTKSPRYLIQICLIPAPAPWADTCARMGLPRDNPDWLSPFGPS